MKTGECQAFLADLLAGASATNPADTLLGRSAAAVLVMARAYESDGRTFQASDDPVNALASFWYGLGWLHFGIAYGLLISNGSMTCPFKEPCRSLPPECSAQLNEKTTRYERLLNTARGSVACAPEPATSAYDFAERILFITSVYAEKGRHERMRGREEDALAAFSYGHGWLDAAVTTGLFRIRAHHKLFTV
jgi:uncharacterized protein